MQYNPEHQCCQKLRSVFPPYTSGIAQDYNVDAAYCDRLSNVVCMCLYVGLVLDTFLSHAKMAELMEMSIGGYTRVDQSNQVLDGVQIP